MQEKVIAHEKKLERVKAKVLREQLHKNQNNMAPKKLLNFVPDILENLKCSIIAGYMPIFTEINIIPLMQALAAEQHQLCLPVTLKSSNILSFRSYVVGQELEFGPYNTMHPGKSSFQVFPDLVFMPLLAFDDDFNRLGYGGGYYDRTIFKFRDSEQKVSFVGVAYTEQSVDKVPISLDDEPMDGILTPSGLKLRRA